MACEVCGKPLRFKADSTTPAGTPQLEPVMCPYGSHDAGQRQTVGWWRSFTMTPDEQESWLAENPQPEPPSFT